MPPVNNPDADNAASPQESRTSSPSTEERQTLLCVDDEPSILAALRRLLRPEGLNVVTATSGKQALTILEALPIDLVISDMRMPEMDGAQFLEQVCLKWPLTTRVLLTGHSDLSSTVAAVNRGRIYRYLQKPWDDEELLACVRDGLRVAARAQDDARGAARAAAHGEQLRQLGEEIVQLQEQHRAFRQGADTAKQRQYLQTVKVLTNLMEVRSPRLFEQGRRVAATARNFARGMGLAPDEVLNIFVAGLLLDVGLIGVADEVLLRLGGPGATAEEDACHRGHPALSARCLAAMEDMLPVAQLIESHHERFDGAGFPKQRRGEDIPLGARILAIAGAVESQKAAGGGESSSAALGEFLKADRGACFDPALVDACLPHLGS